MKNRLFCCCILISLICCSVVACKNADKSSEERGANMSMNLTESENEWYYRSLDDREYLIEVIGFTEEELNNIDIDKFSNYVGLRKIRHDYVRYAYDTRYDQFVNEDYNDTYLIMSVLPNDKIPKGTKIKKIGFNYNPGTFVEDSVFDIEKGVFYVYDRSHIENKYDEYQLDDDLSNIVDEYEIYNWDTVIEGPKDDTTASYGWKLVFLGDDGHKYAYEGFEMSEHVFPEGYTELSKKLNEIIKNRPINAK